MNVQLPETGCNIITDSDAFVNYSPDSRTRTSYIIYEGVAKKQQSTYNQYGYSYTGDCLVTGDLVYRPQDTIYFEVLAILMAILILFVPIYLFFFKWWRPMR